MTRQHPLASVLRQVRDVELLEPRQLLAIDFPSATAVQPLGSLVYESQLEGSIDEPGGQETLRFTLDPNQSYSLLVEPDDDLGLAITRTDGQGNPVRFEAAGAGDAVVVNSVLDAGRTEVTLTALDNSSGSFTARLLINGQFERESYGGPRNDGVAGAQFLPMQDVVSGGTGSFATVLGSAASDGGAVRAIEDFEQAELSDQWAIRSSDATAGVAALSTQVVAVGSQSLLMEVLPNVAPTLTAAQDGEVVVSYDPATGEVAFDTSRPITTLQLKSASGIFTGQPAQGVGQSDFDVDRDDTIFRLGVEGFETGTLGNVAQTGLSLGFLNQDLSIAGSWFGGGRPDFRLAIVGGVAHEATYEVESGILAESFSFDYFSKNNHPDPLPDRFVNSATGDGVAVSSDGGVTWTTVFSPNAADSDWGQHTIDLASLGLAPLAPLQIRFQQFSTPDDSAVQSAFDQLEVIGNSLTGGDWYRIEVPPAARLVIAASDLNGTNSLQTQLFSDRYQLLAIGAANDHDVQIINAYRNAKVLSESVWVRVIGGEGEAYSLSTAINMDFEFARFHDGNLRETRYLAGFADAAGDRFVAPGSSTMTLHTVAPLDGEFTNDGQLFFSVLRGNSIVQTSTLESPQLQIRRTVDEVWVQASEDEAAGEYVIAHSGRLDGFPAEPSLSGNADLGRVTLQFDRSLAPQLDLHTFRFDGQVLALDRTERIDGRTLQLEIPNDLLDGVYRLEYSVVDAESRAHHGEWLWTIDRTGPRVLATSIENDTSIASESLDLSVEFDEPLATGGVDSADVFLVGQSVGRLPTTVTVADRTLTIRAADLPVDRYTVTVMSGDDAIRNQSGEIMDGESVDGSLPSGDGTSGGDFVMSFVNQPERKQLAFESPFPWMPVWLANADGVVNRSPDVELFELPIDSPQRLTVTASPTPELTLQVDLLTADGGALASAEVSAEDPVGFQDLPLAAGDYLIQLRSANGETGAYELDLRFNLHDRFATNSSRDTAISMNEQFRELGLGAEIASLLTKPVPIERSLVAQFSFEQGRLPDGWSVATNSTIPGRGVRITDAVSSSDGNDSLVMDGKTVATSFEGDAQLIYDDQTGGVSLSTRGGTRLTTLEVVSRGGLFRGDPPEQIKPPFDVFQDGKLFLLDIEGFGPESFGSILPPGLTRSNLESQFELDGSVFGGGRAELEWVLSSDLGESISVVAPIELAPNQRPIVQFSHIHWEEPRAPGKSIGQPSAGDGVSFSLDNGQTWLPLFAVPNGSHGNWRNFEVDLGRAIRRLQSEIPNSVLLAFQSWATDAAPLGGSAFDDIRILNAERPDGVAVQRENIVDVSFEDGQLPVDWMVSTDATNSDRGVRVTESVPAADGSHALVMDGQIHLATGPVQTNEDVAVVYDGATGNVSLVMGADTQLSSIELTSRSRQFIPAAISPGLLDTPFNRIDSRVFFLLRPEGISGELSLGNILPSGLSLDDVIDDLAIDGSQLPGGGITAEVTGYGGNLVTSNQVIVPIPVADWVDVRLDFAYANWKDPIDPIRSTSDSLRPMTGDGVAISLDGGRNWQNLFTPPVQVSGAWVEYSIELEQAVEELTDQVLLSFQGRNRAALPTEGVAFDNIRVSGIPTEQLDAWYQFSLDDGQIASVVATSATDQFDIDQLSLYDAQGNLLARSSGMTTLNNLVDVTVNGQSDDYYLQLVGSALDEAFVFVGRDLGFSESADHGTNLLVGGTVAPVQIRPDAGTVTISSRLVALQDATPNTPLDRDGLVPSGASVTLTDLPSLVNLVPSAGNRHHVLRIEGSAQPVAALRSSYPEDNSRHSNSPLFVTLDFDKLRLDSIQSGDVFVNGEPANSIRIDSTSADQTRLIVPVGHLAANETMVEIDAGAFQTIHGLPTEPVRVRYVIDNEGPRLVDLNLVNGQILEIGENLDITLQFNEPISTATQLVITDLSTQLTRAARATIDARDRTRVLSRFEFLPEGNYELTIPALAIRDEIGNPMDGERNEQFPSGDGVLGGDYRIRFVGDAPDPTQADFASFGTTPAGAYRSRTVTRSITADDVDSISATLVAKQVVSAIVTATDAFVGQADLVAPDGSILGSWDFDGSQTLVIPERRVPTTGDYELQVRGREGSTGTFAAQFFANVQFERSDTTTTNSTLANAELVLWDESMEDGVARAVVDGSAADAMEFQTRTGHDFETTTLHAAWTTNIIGGGTVQSAESPGTDPSGRALVMTGANQPIHIDQLLDIDSSTVVVTYDPATGEVALRANHRLTSIELNSASAIFTGATPASLDATHAFNIDSDRKIFKLQTDGFAGYSLGNVAAPGLTTAQLLQDLEIRGSFLGGGQITPFVVALDGTGINEATWSTTIRPGESLQFRWWHDGSRDLIELPAQFLGSAIGDGVSVSQDGRHWHRVPFNVSADANRWSPEIVEIGQWVSDLGFDPARPVKLKFQQSGSLGTLAWDEVQLGSQTDWDWYRIELQDGDSVSALLDQEDPSVELEFFDAAGERIAATIGTEIGLLAINPVVEPRDGVANSIFARVAGSGGAYRLILSRNAISAYHGPIDASQLAVTGNVIAHYSSLSLEGSLEVEPNDSIDDAQSLDALFLMESSPNIVNSGPCPACHDLGHWRWKLRLLFISGPAARDRNV